MEEIKLGIPTESEVDEIGPPNFHLEAPVLNENEF